MKFVALSGSLRSHSSNSELLRAVRELAPSGVSISIFDQLGELPHFNPDLEGDHKGLAPIVAAWRGAVGDADGLIISSPEYARGIPGSLKNALDWLVGSETFAGTPVALFNASQRGVHAQAALRLTLETMAARFVERACLTLPLLGSAVSSREIARDYRTEILRALEELTREVSDLSPARQ